MTEAEKQQRIQNLKFSIIYTPQNQAEMENVIEALDYSRRVGDQAGIMISLAQINQGHRLAALEGRTYEFTH